MTSINQGMHVSVRFSSCIFYAENNTFICSLGMYNFSRLRDELDRIFIMTA